MNGPYNYAKHNYSVHELPYSDLIRRSVGGAILKASIDFIKLMWILVLN